MGEYHSYLIVTAHINRSMKKKIITFGDGLNLGEENLLESTNPAALAAVAFMTSSISLLPQRRSSGMPEGEFDAPWFS